MSRKLIFSMALGLTVGYFLAEVGYRVYRYQKLLAVPTGILTTPKPLYAFDEKTGYRYRGPQDAAFYWWGEGPELIRHNRVRMNAQGHVSHHADPVAKPKNEYRIAVVGDSLSACIHSELPWPDALETLLNQKEFAKHVRGKKVNVVNFSRDGVGVEQFPSILENEVKAYAPDLILVNFITADIYRRFLWRGEVDLDDNTKVVLSCVSLPVSLDNPECQFANNLSMAIGHDDKGQVKAVAERVAKWEARRKPWFTLYPQVAAAVIPEVTHTLFGRNPWTPRTTAIENREEMVEVTSRAIKEMARKHTNVKFLHLPVYWELVAAAVPKLAGEVMRASLPVEITPMVMYMPQNPTREDVDRWTHFPNDMHFSDEGAKVYAQSVKQYLEDLFKRSQSDSIS